jgi:uncharacterized protein (DUF1697 family)
MAEKKPILEEALLDIKNIQSALNANTKEILRSVAREEIDSVVKESLLKEDDYEEEDLETTDTDVETEPTDDVDVVDDVVGDVESGDSEEDGLSDIEGSEEVAPVVEPELGMDSMELGGDELDMTAASDDEVIAIYKKLSGEDEIEIVGDEIHLNISEPGEYVVKTNDIPDGDVAPEEINVDDLEPLGGEEDLDVDVDIDGGDDVDYEIEMGGEEEIGDEAPDDLVPVDTEDGEEEEEEEELTEAIPVGSAQAHRLPGKTKIGQPLGAGADNLKESESKKLVLETNKKYNTLLAEAKKLKSENSEFRTALKEFRTKLVETVVFNSNLTYTTRLFMEHSTTKLEKQSIIKRFDEEVSTLKESKKLYKTIVSELEHRKPINEAIENKIIKEVTTGASKQLNESTAYVDPSTKRIMDLINRVEKR